jgi:hypothetical protein
MRQSDDTLGDFDFAVVAVARELLYLLTIVITRIVGHLGVYRCRVLAENLVDETHALKKE